MIFESHEPIKLEIWLVEKWNGGNFHGLGFCDDVDLLDQLLLVADNELLFLVIDRSIVYDLSNGPIDTSQGRKDFLNKDAFC